MAIQNVNAGFNSTAQYGIRSPDLEQALERSDANSMRPMRPQRLASADLVVRSVALVVGAMGQGGIKAMVGALLGVLAVGHSQGVSDAIVGEVFKGIAEKYPKIGSRRLTDDQTGNIIYAGGEAGIVLKPNGEVYYGKIPFIREPGDKDPRTIEFWRPENSKRWLHRIDGLGPVNFKSNKVQNSLKW